MPHMKKRGNEFVLMPQNNIFSFFQPLFYLYICFIAYSCCDFFSFYCRTIIMQHIDIFFSVFLYYCDMRAVIRETPGDMLIKNCRFGKALKALHLPFGHKWTCNRSLDNITFEDCSFEELAEPIRVDAPDGEPLTAIFKNCSFSARKGAEQNAFAQGKNLRSITLESTNAVGFNIESIDFTPAPEIIIK